MLNATRVLHTSWSQSSRGMRYSKIVDAAVHPRPMNKRAWSLGDTGSSSPHLKTASTAMRGIGSSARTCTAVVHDRRSFEEALVGQLSTYAGSEANAGRAIITSDERLTTADEAVGSAGLPVSCL